MCMEVSDSELIHTLKVLLSDRNLADDASSVALRTVISHYADGRDLLDVVRTTLLQDPMLYLRGPVVSTGLDTVRVCRIMTLNSFARLFPDLPLSEESSNYLLDLLLTNRFAE